MSLVIALKAASGDVVLASDQLGTIGDPRGLVCTDEATEKLLTFKTGAVAMVGDIGHLIIPVDEALKKIERDGNDPLNTIYETVKNHFNLYWPFKKVKEDHIPRPEGSLVFADVKNGSTRISALTSDHDFGPSVHNLSIAMQGMHHYAAYLRRRLWRNDMSLDEITRLAIFAIYETGLVEPKVGKEPVVVKIMCNGEIVKIPKEEIDKIIGENNQRFAAFASRLFQPSEQVRPSN